MSINLPLLHVAVAFAWIGLVAGETVLELNQSLANRTDAET